MGDILCDASSFISLTESCMEKVIYFLTEKHHVRFIIPRGVEDEMVHRPLSTKYKTHGFSALRIKHMIKKGVITSVDTSNVKERANEILRITNNLLFARGKPIKLVHYGEAEMIALAEFLRIKALLIDERTTRMLIETPFTIKKHLEKEFNVHIMMNKKHLKEFSNITSGMYAIRSSELIILAYEKGFFDHFDNMKKDLLEAALKDAKFSGCAIRFDEIEDYIKSIK